MRHHGVVTLLTGHTLDDQAETFMLRLARGSGLDGLSAMAERGAFPSPEFADLVVARPLLGFTHASTLATLRARKQDWIEDPSNANERFARVRIRRALNDLGETGLSAERIASAAAHLRRARDAIDAAVAALSADSVELTKWGYALVTAEGFKAAPREVALRALSRLLAGIGGDPFPPRFDGLEPALDWLTAITGPKGRTLGGCRLVRRERGQVLIAREETALTDEASRTPLTAGETALWDGRFVVALSAAAVREPCEVRALGTAGLRKAGTKLDLPPVEPRRIAAALPALWAGDRLLAAPLVGFHGEGRAFSAVFLRMRPLPAL